MTYATRCCENLHEFKKMGKDGKSGELSHPMNGKNYGGHGNRFRGVKKGLICPLKGFDGGS
jgi:hypothetical protein